MSTLLKKIILVFCTSFLLLSSSLPLAAAVHAQTWYNQSFPEWYLKVYDENSSPPNEIFGERYTATQVQWVIYGFFSNIANAVTGNNTALVSCILSAAGEKTILLNTCKDGVGGIFQKIGDFFDLPKIRQGSLKSVWPLALGFEGRSFSGIGYIKNSLNKLTLISEVKAQTTGFGFDALGTVQNIWKGVRNVAYLLFVVVIIVFSFMIMFRVKINPQMVISIQSALPKIIIAMILVTFSYAIAGLAVDLMYVVTGLLATFLTLAGIGVGNIPTYWAISGQIPLVESFAGSFIILLYMFGYAILFVIAALAALAGTFLSLSVFGMLASIIMIVVWVLVIILKLVYIVKIPLVLIKALVQVYLSVIVAPIQIALGSMIPQIGFGAWFKNLMANLLTFPIVGTLFYLAFFFIMFSISIFFEVAIEQNVIFEIFGFNPKGILPGHLWSPPLLGSGAEMTSIIFMAISFGIIVLIPKATELAKSLIMGEKFSFGTAMGEAMGPLRTGWGMTGAPVTRAFQEVGSKASIGRVAEAADKRLQGKVGVQDWSRAPQWLKDIVGRMK